jgi:hypothetical protein
MGNMMMMMMEWVDLYVVQCTAWHICMLYQRFSPFCMLCCDCTVTFDWLLPAWHAACLAFVA